MSELAGELSERAAQAARKVGDSPAMLGTLGGIVGGGLGLVLAMMARSARRHDVRPAATIHDPEVARALAASDVAAVESRAYEARRSASVADELRERASTGVEAAAETARAAARGVKEVSSAAGEKVASAGERASAAAHAAAEIARQGAHVVGEELGPLKELATDPIVIALGAGAVGAAAAFLVPVTARERDVTLPVKRRAVELARRLARDVGDRIDARIAALADTLGKESGSAEPPQPSIH